MQGIIPAIITPVKDNDVALAVLEQYINWLLQSPIDGVFALGTTGEGLLLKHQAWSDAVQVVTNAVGRAVPVVVQCGGISYADTMARIEAVDSLDVDALALMTPYFYRYSDSDLFEYFQTIMRARPERRFFLYNIPKYTNNTITPSVYERLAQGNANLLGIKDSSGAVESISAFCQAVPELTVLSGSDTLMREAAAVGAAGVVSGVGAALPRLVTNAWAELQQGNPREAEVLVEVTKAFHKTSTIAAARMALEAQGLPVGNCFLPLSAPTDVDRARLAADLQALGVPLG